MAAPTTSLPEAIGGSRNWDYRFCWLRDATLTLLALMNAGYYDEARAWRDWLLRAAAGAPSQLQIMYGLAGERRLTEYEVPVAAGYEGSRPRADRQCRARPTAARCLWRGDGRAASGASRWTRLARGRLGVSARDARAPHRSLESAGRGHLGGARRAPRHFTYSKVMAWVAFDRGIRAMETFGSTDRSSAGGPSRRAIHDDVCTRGFDPDVGSFVQSYGSKELDASLLLLPTVGFLPPTDPRMRGTVDAVERRLFVDGFLLRYDTRTSDDGLPGGEGAFLACSFWLADAYVLLNRMDDARRLFERLLGLRNDVGLLAGGIRHTGAAPGRQLSSGVLAYRARQHRAQSGARHQAGGATVGVVDGHAAFVRVGHDGGGDASRSAFALHGMSRQANTAGDSLVRYRDGGIRPFTRWPRPSAALRAAIQGHSWRSSSRPFFHT